MGVFKAIIFDMDGVLIDSEPLFLKAINRQMAEESVAPISEDENRDHLIGTTVEETWLGLKKLRDLPLSIAEYIERYEVLVEQVLKEELAAQPGVVELIRECQRRGLPKAVASSSLRSWVHLKLDSIGLQDVFEVVLGGDDVTRGKPEPDIYLLAAERLGLPPQECIAIEDSPVGIAAAVSAGTHTIAVRTESTKGLDTSKAHSVLDSLTEFDCSLLADHP